MLSRIAILVTLVACNDRDTAQMAAIRSKVCACKTASCAEQEIKVVPEQLIKSTHRTQGIAREMIDCIVRLHEAERPSADPSEDGTEPPGGEPSAGESSAAPSAMPADRGSAPPAIPPPSR